MKKYGVIMAGGAGTRFWPLSNQTTPKQLLNLSGKDFLINEAIERLALLTERENIFIVTSRAQAEKVRVATEGKIPQGNILAEPAARGTAACIAYAAVHILKKYGDGVMIITPSDAYIRDDKAFAETLCIAAEQAETTDTLVTVGIVPTFPSTGYGYIRKGRTEGRVNPVLRFVEKPDAVTAEKYVKSGEYVWNSGIFVWKASLILKKFKLFLPEIYEGILKIAELFGTEDEVAAVEEIYLALCNISIDYGIMEKSDDIMVVSGNFDWSDVGSWDMLGALYSADGQGNICVGDVLAADTENSVLYSSGRTLAVLGVKDLVVVETPNAVMVCPKARAQEVKMLAERLNTAQEKERA